MLGNGPAHSSVHASRRAGSWQPVSQRASTRRHSSTRSSRPSGAPAVRNSMPAAEEQEQRPQEASAPVAAEEAADAMAASSSSTLARWQQNMNVAGISLFLRILGGDKRLAVPHLSVPDISSVNWERLRQAGFQAVVFDKDNTLTKPFEMQVEPKLQASLARCKQVFGASGIALYSNSAGLQQYDPQGHEAQALESALGVAVLRHKDKKPAGDAAEVAAHFGCAAHKLVMVGDRYLTDVVFGNRHGMLTIRPAPLTRQGEPAGVLVARQVEEFFVQWWQRSGVKAPDHVLLKSDPSATPGTGDPCQAFVLRGSDEGSAQTPT